MREEISKESEEKRISGEAYDTNKQTIYTPCFIKSGPLCIITFSNVDRFEWKLHHCIL